MTQVPDIPEERRSFEDGPIPAQPGTEERNGHDTVLGRPLPDPAGTEAGTAKGRFGTLNQSALNRWSVRDRET